MLKIRLQRVGRKHEPSFRLVLTDSKNSTKSGRFKEILGSYDPRKAVEAFKSDRIRHWLSVGVGVTPTINNLLVRNKIVTGKKIDVSNTVPIAATPEVEEVKTEPAPEASAPSEVAEVTPEVPETPATEELPAEETKPSTESPAGPEEEPVV